MKTSKITAHFVANSLLLTGLSALCLITIWATMPRHAYAAPAITIIADGTAPCSLPDGTPGLTGSSSTGNPVCCPQDAQGNISCLYAKYLNPLIQLLSAAVGVAVVIGIVYGAIEYITSNGDPQRAAAGKKRIVNALIALAAFLFLYAFLQFIVPGGLMHA